MHGVKENTFTTVLPEQQAAFGEAVKFWSDIANIDLKLGTPYSFTTGSTTLQFGDIVVANGELEQLPKELTLASTIAPSSIRDTVNSSGDIVIDIVQGNSSNLSLKPGHEGFSTLIHELGHALGLEHPVVYLGMTPRATALSSDPGMRYTIMSYAEDKYIKNDDGTQWYPTKPMLYDILAIQTLYGVNPNTEKGDNTGELVVSPF